MKIEIRGVFCFPWIWDLTTNNNMTVWILAENYTSFTIAAGLIRLHMPGVKKYRE